MALYFLIPHPVKIFTFSVLSEINVALCVKGSLVSCEPDICMQNYPRIENLKSKSSVSAECESIFSPKAN